MRSITILVAAVATAAALAATVSSSWADGYRHDHGTMTHGSSGHSSRVLAKAVADLRLVLAPYATNLDAAKQAGYSRQITPMMANMDMNCPVMSTAPMAPIMASGNASMMVNGSSRLSNCAAKII